MSSFVLYSWTCSRRPAFAVLSFHVRRRAVRRVGVFTAATALGTVEFWLESVPVTELTRRKMLRVPFEGFSGAQG